MIFIQIKLIQIDIKIQKIQKINKDKKIISSILVHL
jgi:hypothetical protein